MDPGRHAQPVLPDREALPVRRLVQAPALRVILLPDPVHPADRMASLLCLNGPHVGQVAASPLRDQHPGTHPVCLHECGGQRCPERLLLEHGEAARVGVGGVDDVGVAAERAGQLHRDVKLVPHGHRLEHHQLVRPQAQVWICTVRRHEALSSGALHFQQGCCRCRRGCCASGSDGTRARRLAVPHTGERLNDPGVEGVQHLIAEMQQADVQPWLWLVHELPAHHTPAPHRGVDSRSHSLDVVGLQADARSRDGPIDPKRLECQLRPSPFQLWDELLQDCDLYLLCHGKLAFVY
mmetsp:Transcript_99848/g.242801  ORF Transcript_99848/g.242801 Transcript_99848/m.242801 type:complete len:294 (+) Transcript_99848:403-1284(+)